MKRRISLLVGAMVLSIAAIAPAAQAQVSLLNSQGNAIAPSEEAAFAGTDPVSTVFSGGAEIYCDSFAFIAIVGENPGNPLTLSMGYNEWTNGTQAGDCEIPPLGIEVNYEIEATGDIQVNSNGTGSMPIKLTQSRPSWGSYSCYFTGTMPLEWSSSAPSQVVFQNGKLTGSGGYCTYGTLNLGHFDLYDPSGASAKLVAN